MRASMNRSAGIALGRAKLIVHPIHLTLLGTITLWSALQKYRPHFLLFGSFQQALMSSGVMGLE